MSIQNKLFSLFGMLCEVPQQTNNLTCRQYVQYRIIAKYTPWGEMKVHQQKTTVSGGKSNIILQSRATRLIC